MGEGRASSFPPSLAGRKSAQQPWKQPLRVHSLTKQSATRRSCCFHPKDHVWTLHRFKMNERVFFKINLNCYNKTPGFLSTEVGSSLQEVLMSQLGTPVTTLYWAVCKKWCHTYWQSQLSRKPFLVSYPSGLETGWGVILNYMTGKGRILQTFIIWYRVSLLSINFIF